MPNDTDSSSRADLAIITHMEDVDRYKGPPGEGTTASQSAGRVSIASDVRKLRGRAACAMTLLFPEECGQGRARRHKHSCTLLRSNEALANAKLGERCVTTARRGPQGRRRKEAVL
jgi:hypothetical protein